MGRALSTWAACGEPRLVPGRAVGDAKLDQPDRGRRFEGERCPEVQARLIQSAFQESLSFFNILKKPQRFCITRFFRPRSQKSSKTRPFCHSRPEKSWRKPKHGLEPVHGKNRTIARSR